jgi:hypothetical protein
MPKRIVSWSVLLFSFAIISLGYKPETNQWGFGYDSQFHVPFMTSPYIVYEIFGVVAIVLSLFFIIASFRKTWRERVEEFINTKAYYPSFVIFWIVYILGYVKGISSVISISPPTWVVLLAFYYGFILFLLIPIMYFIGLSELKGKK